MKRKYLILDFGKVLAGPTTGHWFITPKFLELVDMNYVNDLELSLAIEKYNYILSRVMKNQEEEYHDFCEFYECVLKEIKYPKYSNVIVHDIAYNFVYSDDKYTFYDNVLEELKILKNKYKLILLTDNWPCIDSILEKHDLVKYFEKIYVSSYYGVLKKEGIFFDYPLKDFFISDGEALFVDDSEENLVAAEKKGLDVLLMDREKIVSHSDYEIIHTLLDILNVE